VVAEVGDKAAPQMWFQPQPIFSFLTDTLDKADLSADRHVEPPLLQPHNPCAYFAAVTFTSFHLLEPK
jgi:hypothetical protein